MTLLFLSLLSGMGGVAYEVLYLRHLTTLFGDMFYVHAALLSTFLLGMGLGARLAHRFMRHLYAFELATGVYALCLPALARAYEASPLNDLFPDPGISAVFAVIALLAVPSVCVGFSIPLFSEYLKRQSDGKDAFPRVYGLYNLGACVCVLLVEFHLIRGLGIAASLAAVGLINVLCGLVLLARRSTWPGVRLDAAPEARSLLGPRDLRALFLASLASALFQGFYFKVCYHLFLPHRENFALCTGVALLAIALGTLLVRKLKLGFADCLLYAVLSMAAVYAAFSPLSRLYDWAMSAETGPLCGPVSIKLLFAFLLGGIPLAFLGGTIPALLHREGAIAHDSGRLLFVSGLANALGYLAYVFLAHPYLKLFTVLTIAALLMASAAILHAGPSFAARRAFTAAIAGLLLVLAHRCPEHVVYAMNMAHGPEARFKHFKSGSDNVTLIEQGKDASITYNGHPSVAVRTRGRINEGEVSWGVRPALLAPRTGRALSIGMGTGMTAGALARIFERTDVVEINRAFFDLSPELAEANLSLSRNPSAHLVHDDGRRFLGRTAERYDLILNSVPTPTFYSAGKLYTSEYLDLVKKALARDGVFCVWFSVRRLSADGVRTLTATLARRFRHGALGVLGNGHYLLAASDRPIRPKPFGGLPVPEELKRTLAEAVRFVSLDAYYESSFLPGDFFARMELEDVPLNTDDLPLLEFQIMRLGPLRPRRSRSRPEDDLAGDIASMFAPGSDTPSLDKMLVLYHMDMEVFARSYGPILDRDEKLRRSFYKAALKDHLLRDGSGSMDELLLLAGTALRAEKYPLAQSYCSKALRLSPLKPSLHALQARIHALRKDQEAHERSRLTYKALTGGR